VYVNAGFLPHLRCLNVIVFTIMSTAVQTNVGRITQIIGPVLDVAFPPGKVPGIYNALVVKGQNEAGDELAITCEVQQLLGDYCVRAVSMNATDGLMRGMEVLDTGNPLTVPVGQPTRDVFLTF